MSVQIAKTVSDADRERLSRMDAEALHAEACEHRQFIRDFRAVAKENDEAPASYDRAIERGDYGDKTASDLREDVMKHRDLGEAAQKMLMARIREDRTNAVADMELPDPSLSHVETRPDIVGKESPRNAMSYLINSATNVPDQDAFQEQMRAALKTNTPFAFELEGTHLGHIMNTITPVTTSTGTSVDTFRWGPGVVMGHDPKMGIAATLQTVECPANTDTLKFPRESGTFGSVPANNFGDSNYAGNSAGAAAPTLESGESPSQVIATTDISVTVRKISVMLTVTEEQVDDVPTFMSHADARLGRIMRNVLEQQVVNGDGDDLDSRKSMRGLNHITGTESLGVRGSTTIMDHTVDGYNKLWSSGNTAPTYIAFNYDMLSKFMKEKDGDDRYLWSSAIGGAAGEIFGVPYVISQYVADNTGIALNTEDFRILRKGGLKMEMGLNGNDFAAGRRALRLSFRANVVPYLPKSLVKINYAVS